MIFRKSLWGSCFFISLFIMQCSSLRMAGTYSRLDESQFNQTTQKYIGSPYAWGGMSTSGVDCSGLTSQVYKEQGILLPRTSKEQYTIGKTISLDNVKKGDLLFFNTFGSGVSHVGLYIDDHRMLHASSNDGVKYSRYDTDYWKKRYIAAKRVVGSPYIKGVKSTENIAVMTEFPMRITSLLSVPTPYTLDRRHVSLDFRTNVMGNLVMSSAIGFWNRWEVGTALTFNEVLGNAEMGVEIPQFYTKFRFWNEGSWYPSAALGYGNTRLKKTWDDSLGVAQETWGAPRGLFTVFNKTVFNGFKWIVGEGKTYLGLGTTHVLKDLQLDNLYMFFAYEQQILSQAVLILEADDIFRSGTINAGFRVALTAETSIEFALTHLFEAKTNMDRALRFIYYLPY